MGHKKARTACPRVELEPPSLKCSGTILTLTRGNEVSVAMGSSVLGRDAVFTNKQTLKKEKEKGIVLCIRIKQISEARLRERRMRVVWAVLCVLLAIGLYGLSHFQPRPNGSCIPPGGLPAIRSAMCDS